MKKYLLLVTTFLNAQNYPLEYADQGNYSEFS